MRNRDKAAGHEHVCPTSQPAAIAHPSAATALRVEETAGAIAVAGDGYGLRVSRREPAIELTLNGRAIATLRADSGVDATDTLDERTRLGAPALSREPDGAVVVRWRGGSDRWASKGGELRAWAGGLS